MKQVEVACIQATPRTILDDYAHVLELVDFRRRLISAFPIHVEWRVTRRLPFPGANTPPWQLEGVLRALQRQGFSSSTTGVFPAERNDFNGYAPILKKYGVEVLPAPDANIVYLTTPGFSALQKPQSGAPALTIVDATTIAYGQSGLPEPRNLIVASSDHVAVETVMARLLNYAPSHILPCLRHASAVDLNQIELIGDGDVPAWRTSPIARENTIFPPFDRLLRWRAYNRWSAKDRRIFESWLRHTGWGRLFQEYQRNT